MRHHNTYRKLGRDSSHRAALLKNLATSLVIHNRIETTLEKAKELKRIADRLVTLGKKNSLHARRQAIASLNVVNRTEKGNAGKRLAMHRLFEEIAPRYLERDGGYTRVIRTRKRDGDKAQMAIIEFVEETLTAKEPAKKTRKTKRAVSAENTPAKQAASVSKTEDVVADQAVSSDTSTEASEGEKDNG